MKKISWIIYSLFLCLIMVSCGGKDEPVVSARRTVIVYMVATNSLGDNNCDTKDIAEMDLAVKNNDMNNCRLVVYWVTRSANPKLMEIIKAGNTSSHKVLKQYTSDIRSTSPARMKQVINDVKAIAPADDYGLVLWSHASGWARTLSTMKLKGKTIRLLDYGEDLGNTMPIDSLAASIPDGMFNFIYSDVCYMGGIEDAYELRNKTHFFIGSPTEIPIDGMPYDKNMPCFFETIPSLKKSCENTFDYYNSLSGIDRTATIALIDCTYLDDLATLCRQIHQNSIQLGDISGIQYYKYSSPYLFFDFKQYTDLLASAAQKLQLSTLLEKVVIYKASTPKIFNYITIDPDNFSGLSTYILGTAGTTNELYYKTLSWYKAVYQ